MTKSFSLETVLSITTGRLLCPMEEIYEILDFMTGTSLFTHQLPRAADVCGPSLRNQFPELARADARMPKLAETLAGCLNKGKTCADWVSSMKADGFPSAYEVAPLPNGVYASQNPLAELERMLGPKWCGGKVFVVETQEQQS